jgi:hypothetical protein
VKLPVVCGVKDGAGKTCMKDLGEIDLPGFPSSSWYRNGEYQRLRWDERDYDCPKHGAVQIHEVDVLHEALRPGPPRRQRVLRAKRPVRVVDPTAQRL